jgi:hypothetical protein
LIGYLNDTSRQTAEVLRQTDPLTRGIKTHILEKNDGKAQGDFAQQLVKTTQEILQTFEPLSKQDHAAEKSRIELATLMALESITEKGGWQSRLISKATQDWLRTISDGVDQQRVDRDQILETLYRNVVFLQGLTPRISNPASGDLLEKYPVNLRVNIARTLQRCANGQVPSDKSSPSWNKSGSSQDKISEAEAVLEKYKTLAGRFSGLRSSLTSVPPPIDSKREA